VLVVCGSDFDGTKEEALAAGASGYCAKVGLDDVLIAFCDRYTRMTDR